MPVIQNNGGVEWIDWGKRIDENVPHFPYGGWVRLDKIQSGIWKRFNPTNVLIPIHSHIGRDSKRQSHWIDLKSDEVKQD